MKKPFIIITSLLILSTIFYCGLYIKNKRDYIGFNYNLLQSGDIIFTRGISMKSFVVLLLNRSTDRYSHCGVIFREKDKYFIIHSTPTPIDKKNGRIVREPLDDFFSFNNITLTSIYRVDNGHKKYIDSSLCIIKHFLQDKIAFDDDFQLTNQKLYCTELIWLAYKNAGLDLTGKDYFNKIIYPSDLINSKYLMHIYTF